MNPSRFEQILAQIARANRTTVAVVRREMILAMEEGQNSKDPIVRARWNAVPRKGDRVTLEEFVDYMARQMQKRKEERRKPLLLC